MLDIDPHSRVAIYEQIKTQIMELIAVGALKPHAQLPSIRALEILSSPDTYNTFPQRL